MFLVHKSLLLKYPGPFADLLKDMGPFQTRPILLETVPVYIFRALCQWLYTGDIVDFQRNTCSLMADFNNHRFVHDQDEGWVQSMNTDELLALWLFAGRMEIPGLQDAAMLVLQEETETASITVAQINLVFKSTFPDSKLRPAVIGSFLWDCDRSALVCDEVSEFHDLCQEAWSLLLYQALALRKYVVGPGLNSLAEIYDDPWQVIFIGSDGFERVPNLNISETQPDSTEK